MSLFDGKREASSRGSGDADGRFPPSPFGGEGYELYDYQQDTIDEARQRLKKGSRRECICLTTGAGKTIIASSFLLEFHKKKQEQTGEARNKKALFICDRINLRSQTSNVLWKAKVPHGNFQGRHRHGLWRNVIVCSIQSITKRPVDKNNPEKVLKTQMEKWIEDGLIEMIIWDECHEGIERMERALKGWDGILLGLTATPFTNRMAEIFATRDHNTGEDRIINPVTTMQLLERGRLVRMIPYASEVNAQMDTDKVATKGADYDQESAAEAGQPIIGDIVLDTYKTYERDHGGQVVQTLIFVPTVAYGMDLAARFQNALFHGRRVDARCSSYKDNAEESERVVDAFKRNEFDILISVDKFTKGFDHPGIRHLVLARPTKSFKVHMQQLGRGARPAPDKLFCTVNCHVGNMKGFWRDMWKFIMEGPEKLLKKRERGKQKRRKKDDSDPCPECGALLPPKTKECPACGFVLPKPKPRVAEVSGKMTRLEEIKAGGVRSNKRDWLWGETAKWAVGICSRKPEKAQKLARVYYHKLMGHWPPKSWPEATNYHGHADDEVRKALNVLFNRWTRRPKTKALQATNKPSWADEMDATNKPKKKRDG